MIRVLLIGGIVAIAFTLYALIDAAMADRSRARGISKPAWIIVIILLPVIGGLLWFFLGRGPVGSTPQVRAPDDDPRFTGTKLSNEDLDKHMEDLEARLAELDNETFPGEESDSQPPAEEREVEPSERGGSRSKRAEGADAAEGDTADTDITGNTGDTSDASDTSDTSDASDTNDTDDASDATDAPPEKPA